MKLPNLRSPGALWGAVFLLSLAGARGADKRIVFLAGTPSHGPGEHEYRAGCLLLAQCLESVPGVHTEVITNGWPADPTAAFAGAAAIVVSCDGGASHPLAVAGRLDALDCVMTNGTGLALIHWAVEAPEGPIRERFLHWAGGYYETGWSVNPVWEADFKTLPVHPATRGVRPFKLRDEWYYHMRFVPGRQGVTPLLQTVPSANSLRRADGPHSGNPAVRAEVARGEPQVVSWAYERADGGRGFGFTGGHDHRNWGDPNYRKLVLNALLWIAKVEVPANGVACPVDAAGLTANLDAKRE